jgi:hypothetical protein
MRYDLAEREAMNMSVSTIIEILLYGCDPLDLVENEEIKEEWESIFGKSVDNPE